MGNINNTQHVAQYKNTLHNNRAVCDVVFNGRRFLAVFSSVRLVFLRYFFDHLPIFKQVSEIQKITQISPTNQAIAKVCHGHNKTRATIFAHVYYYYGI